MHTAASPAVAEASFGPHFAASPAPACEADADADAEDEIPADLPVPSPDVEHPAARTAARTAQETVVRRMIPPGSDHFPGIMDRVQARAEPPWPYCDER